MPDLTIVLDLPSEKAAARIALARPLDRMEQQGKEFHARVRKGFLLEAARFPDRIVVVNADASIDAVQAEIRKAVQQTLSR
jgi:dTMP kinase